PANGLDGRAEEADERAHVCDTPSRRGTGSAAPSRASPALRGRDEGVVTSKAASALESDLVVLPIACLLPLKQVTEVIKKSEKYLAIAASIDEIGVIEPLVVFRKPDRRGRFLLLDGHLKREILADHGVVEAECLLATDDEAFSYNKQVNSL